MVVLPRLYGKCLFVYGTSKDVLPQLFKTIGQIDLFWHDSLHKYEYMKFEYETALPYSRYIGSHDINHIGAGNVWNEFVTKNNIKIILQKSKWAIGENLKWEK